MFTVWTVLIQTVDVQPLGQNGTGIGFADILLGKVGNENEVRELAARALQEFGKVDVLVNNAGMALYNEFKKKTLQGFEQSMQVNLYAPFLLTQILGVEMAKNKYGKTRRSSKTGSVSCK